jgi:tRNA-dihydrouridine synthase
VRDAVPAEIPVTLKMRRGIDDSALSRDRFFEILDGAFEQGVAAVTVHGRTVEQKYVGPSNWTFLQEVKAHVGSRTILGSGDLFTADDCLRMLRQTGVDGVTIARGAIGNPWIFRQALQGWQGDFQAEPPTILQQKQVLLRHRALLQEAYGLQRWLGQMRKFCFKYSRLHPRHVPLRNAWATVRDPAGWDEVLNQYFSEDGPGCLASGDESTGDGDCC